MIPFLTFNASDLTVNAKNFSTIPKIEDNLSEKPRNNRAYWPTVLFQSTKFIPLVFLLMTVPSHRLTIAILHHLKTSRKVPFTILLQGLREDKNVLFHVLIPASKYAVTQIGGLTGTAKAVLKSWFAPMLAMENEHSIQLVWPSLLAGILTEVVVDPPTNRWSPEELSWLESKAIPDLRNAARDQDVSISVVHVPMRSDEMDHDPDDIPRHPNDLFAPKLKATSTLVFQDKAWSIAKNASVENCHHSFLLDEDPSVFDCVLVPIRRSYSPASRPSVPRPPLPSAKAAADALVELASSSSVKVLPVKDDQAPTSFALSHKFQASLEQLLESNEARDRENAELEQRIKELQEEERKLDMYITSLHTFIVARKN